MTAPFLGRLSGNLPGAATAVDDSVVLGRAPFAGSVTRASYTPDAAITGAATNTRAIRIRNRGQDGTGVVVVAELQFNAGINAAAFDETTLPLTATVAVAEGDILEAFTDAVGTGLADPGGLVVVEVNRG